ncbi:hypothetical protein F4802DRAFT_269135 [Xylaria palmicola]|nr:hypothetical protein F4802DRAFT_269135 [Xylaria palmicola]
MSISPVVGRQGASLSNLPSTLSSPQPRTEVVVHGQIRSRGPIPLVATNPDQPLPAHLNRDYDCGHHVQHPDSYHPDTNEMGSGLQDRQSTLPVQVEDDIRAAVLAALPSTDSPEPVRKRRSVGPRKALRWLSLSLSIVLIVGEIVAALVLGCGVELDAILAFVWGPLLAIWNGWRLFRIRQKFDREVVSGWHVALDAVFVLATFAITAYLIFWAVSQVKQSGYRYGYAISAFWRAAAAAIIFLFWLVLHSILFIITIVEKWTKPSRPYWDAPPPQAPPVVVQYMPTFTACHGQVEPKPGEHKNAGLAQIGDSQPQGIAPA